MFEIVESEELVLLFPNAPGRVSQHMPAPTRVLQDHNPVSHFVCFLLVQKAAPVCNKTLLDPFKLQRGLVVEAIVLSNSYYNVVALEETLSLPYFLRNKVNFPGASVRHHKQTAVPAWVTYHYLLLVNAIHFSYGLIVNNGVSIWLAKLINTGLVS